MPNQKYQVIIKGGPTGVLSVDGKQLSGTNTTLPGGASAFAWEFKTGTQNCTIDRLETTPEEVTVHTIGAQAKYSTQPWSPSDECSTNGQRLNPYQYNYNWRPLTGDPPNVPDQTNELVGYVSENNIVPFPPPANRCLLSNTPCLA